MDIVLLSKMVKELILDNDKVALPGLGAFVAEIVPSTFSDRGYTINPPYRKLSFRCVVEPDTLLVQFYAANNGVGIDVAAQIMESFIKEISRTLASNRVLQLPGLGRLRTGRDGSIFFVADEDLDIFPAGFGLEPISLKSHQKPSSFDFSSLDVMASHPTNIEMPVFDSEQCQAEDQSDAKVIEEVSEAEIPVESVCDAGEHESRRCSAGRIAATVILSLLVAAGIVAGVFWYLVHYQPEFLDRLLYTDEELEIIHYNIENKDLLDIL